MSPRRLRGSGPQSGFPRAQTSRPKPAPRSAARLAWPLLLAGAAACARGDATPLPPPAVLSVSGSNPTAALDPGSGTGWVAWVETVDGVSNVLLARVGPDGAPSEPVRVNDVPGDAAPHLQAPPRVAVGPEGNVYVAWQNNEWLPGRPFPTSDLRFARSTDGGATFEPAVTVNDDRDGPPASHTFHDMIVAPGGEVVVSWLDGRRSAEVAEAAMAAAGAEAAAAAGAPAEPPAPGAHAGHGAAGAMADAMRAGAAAGAPDEGPDIRVSVSSDGGKTFSASTVVDAAACPCCRTDLAASPDGTLWVAWRKVFPGDVRDVVLARSDDGGRSWQEPVRVHADGWVFPGCPHAGPALAAAPDGTLHVAWYTGKPDGPGLYYARSADGGRSFSEPVALVDAEFVPPSQADLAAATDGSLWAAWEDRTGGARRTLLSREGLPESRTEEISGTNPSLARGGGAALVAWLRGDTVLVSRSGG